MANPLPDICGAMALAPQGVQNLGQLNGQCPSYYLTEPSVAAGRELSISSTVPLQLPWLTPHQPHPASSLEINFTTPPHYAANVCVLQPATVTSNCNTVNQAVAPNPLTEKRGISLPFKKRAHAEKVATTSNMSLSSDTPSLDTFAVKEQCLEHRYVGLGTNIDRTDVCKFSDQTAKLTSPSSIISAQQYWDPALLPQSSLSITQQNTTTSPSPQLSSLNLSTRCNNFAADQIFSVPERDDPCREHWHETNPLDFKVQQAPLLNWGPVETERLLWCELKAAKVEITEINDTLKKLKDIVPVLNGKELLCLEPLQWLKVSPKYGDRLYNVVANAAKVKTLPLVDWGRQDTERLLWASLRSAKADDTEIENIFQKLRDEVEDIDGKALLFLEPSQWLKVSPKYGVQLYNIVANAANPDIGRRQQSDDVSKKPPQRPRRRRDQCVGQLWEFIIQKLKDESTNPSVISWEDENRKLFRINDTEKIARLWGEHKGNKNMTYANMSRTMRYYDKGKGAFIPDDRKRVYGFGPKAKLDEVMAKIAKR